MQREQILAKEWKGCEVRRGRGIELKQQAAIAAGYLHGTHLAVNNNAYKSRHNRIPSSINRSDTPDDAKPPF